MEVLRALAALVETPLAEHERLASLLGLPRAPSPDEHAELFLFNLYPYASVYVGDEGMIGGEAQDRAAGLWRALKLSPPTEPDHLAALLALHAAIVDHEGEERDPARRALWRQARKASLWEQLASWVFAYLDKLDEIAPPVYRAWGRGLRDTVLTEIDQLGPADALPLHLRAARPLPSPEDADVTADAWLGAMLAPARSGMIVTRADLARAASDLSLGLRAGERRYTLRALLAQDTEGVLDWLAREAERWVARHGRYAEASGEIARWWRERARAGAAALLALRDQARART